MGTSSQRGQPQTKMLISELRKIVEDRGHELISADTSPNFKDVVPKQSYIFLKCNKCENAWKTKLYVYLGRSTQSNGCRTCYNKMCTNPAIFPNSPCISKRTEESAKTISSLRRGGRNTLREYNRNSAFGHIKNRSELIAYLEGSQDSYSKVVLPFILREDGLKQQGLSLLDSVIHPNNQARHHIIPLHLKGSPDSWNIVTVSHREHQALHEALFSAYNKQEDRLAIHGAKAHADKFDNSVPVKPVKLSMKLIHGKNNLAPEVKKALKTGMKWKHLCGVFVIIEPGKFETMAQIIDSLVHALPPDHPDKFRIEKNKTSCNYFRMHIITKFPISSEPSVVKKVDSAYGFRVEPLSS